MTSTGAELSQLAVLATEYVDCPTTQSGWNEEGEYGN